MGGFLRELVEWETIYLRRVSIGNFLRQKCQRHTTVRVLALATLGDVIQIEMILSVSRRPMWPRQVQSCDCRCAVPDSFANKHR